ncbi:MAG TPA: hypothetical protein VF642_08945 [Propionibacteriaceae bacterium]|jgi:hypothetical protein
MSSANDVQSRATNSGPLTKLSLSERLIVLAAGLGLLHHTDHVLRFDHSGWPFRPEVSPFTYSLLVYPLLVGVFVLRSYPWMRVALMVLVFLGLQVAHVFFEPPSHQYGTWARGHGQTPSGAKPPNLLEIAAPLLGVLSAGLSIILSLITLATIVSLVRDALTASRSAAEAR